MSKNVKNLLPVHPHEKDIKPHDQVNPNGLHAANLLSRPHPTGYTQEWMESLKHPIVEEATPRQSLLIFRIKSEWLALPSHCIREITQTSFIHSLPHTKSDVLLGITNVQGNLLITISMQNLLGIPDTEQVSPDHHGYTRNIVFGNKKEIFVFPVEEIYGLIHLKPGKIESTPISISKSPKNFFSGIFTLPDNALSIGLLDEKLIINSLNENYL